MWADIVRILMPLVAALLVLYGSILVMKAYLQEYKEKYMRPLQLFFAGAAYLAAVIIFYVTIP